MASTNSKNRSRMHARKRRLISSILIALTILLVGSNLLATNSKSKKSRQTVVAPTKHFLKAEKYEAMQGGAATSLKHINENAFSHPSANLTNEQRLDFSIGNGIFKRLWVSAPASTQSADGLGPLFNARSCQRCHIKDGRGHPPEFPLDISLNSDKQISQLDQNAISMIVRLSMPRQQSFEKDARHRNTIGDPMYGTQLQDFSIQGVKAEGRFNITYREVPISLANNEIVSLRDPTYYFGELNYGPLHHDVRLSPRIAPQMIGLGLLEAISVDAILAREDSEDSDGDGISGRANWVWDIPKKQMSLGRFGWKAGSPTILQQSAFAFATDIGISSPLITNPAGDCTPDQTRCINAPHGANVLEGEGKTLSKFEVSEKMLDLVAFYSANLAVPKRRNVNSEAVLKGKELFYQNGCVGCHTPKYITSNQAKIPELANQLIWPYTDLLLHDMGEGLADNSPEALANGREWRTPPLWGIGLTKKVNGHTYFLHDGRARNLLEAILWHGGEATSSQLSVRQMTNTERNNLILFLESL